MHSKSKFFKSTWENAQPSIEIDPYEYSEVGFNRILEVLIKSYSCEMPEILVGLEKFMATLEVKKEQIKVDMDNWGCGLAFQSGNMRDEVLNLLNASNI